MRETRPSRSDCRSVEWPTLGVAAAIYVSFGLLTWHHAALPGWLVLVAGGFVVAWHGSLQHEVVHGHPTPWRPVNEALVLPSLWLWLPFGVYRESHLVHHDNDRLTDPIADPESYYLTRERWRRAGPLRRAVLAMHNTLAGRLVIGPLVSVARLAADEGARLARGDLGHLRHWAVHLAGCALTLGWVVGVCGITPVEYLLLYAWPGLSLTLLRSYAEHQGAETLAARTSVVEAGPLWSLLFLNNNLHVVHHRRPGLPWYAIPARWRAEREQHLRAADRGPVFPGYGAIVRRHLLTMREPVAHPNP